MIPGTTDHRTTEPNPPQTGRLARMIESSATTAPQFGERRLATPNTASPIHSSTYRLFASIALLMSFVFLLWVLPWTPFGLVNRGWGGPDWIALALVWGSGASTALALTYRGRSSADRKLERLWRLVFGGGNTIRNRHQFRSRLERECKRAKADRRTALSLILVRVLPPETASDPRSLFENAGRALLARVRTSDTVGVIGEDELGVLAIGANAEVSEMIAARLAKALAADFAADADAGSRPHASILSLGPSTFEEADTPDSFIARARQNLTPIPDLLAPAA